MPASRVTTVLVLGPVGCGKTTVLAVIEDALRQWGFPEGSVQVVDEGYRSAQEGQAARAQIMAGLRENPSRFNRLFRVEVQAHALLRDAGHVGT